MDQSSPCATLQPDLTPKIAEQHGRVVKLMGDGLLAEFVSVVEAVQAAAEMQQALAARNATLQPDQRIEFRVGVNLGDVVIDGENNLRSSPHWAHTQRAPDTSRVHLRPGSGTIDFSDEVH